MNNDKKIAILIGDGMSDFPMDELGGRTPLEAADTPNMDYAAQNGLLGMTMTVPQGMPPGSDTANLSIFGYDPKLYFTGRASLEAVNLNIELGKNDAAFRCNLVNIENNIMTDFCADHIETEFTRVIIEELNKKNKIEKIKFFPGVSYRNILIYRDYKYENIPESTPPHDIQGKKIDNYLPSGEGSEFLRQLMVDFVKIFNESEIIKQASLRYKGNPNSIWLWGGGKKPHMKTLQKRFGLSGYTISAVDLIHGIGRLAGLSPLHVDGVTGYIDTNYIGKADALLEGLKTSNFVYLHVESPDESGHEGNLENKIMAIEDFDKKVVGRVLDGITNFNEFTLLIMPDHPTPIKLKTHTSDPVPFCLYSNKNISGFRKSLKIASGYNEKEATGTGLLINEAHNLIEIMIDNKIKKSL